MRLFPHVLVFGLASVLASAALAVEYTAYGPVAGCFRAKVSGGSESLFSIPLERRTEIAAKVLAVGTDRLTLAIPPGTPDGAFNPTSNRTCYLRFSTGALAGLTYPVVSSSTAGVFVLAMKGDNLTSHGLGAISTGAASIAADVVRIRAAWTIGALLEPVAGAPVLAPTADIPGSVYLKDDAVFFPDQAGVGTDKAPAALAAYVTGTGWRASDAPEVDAAGRSILPGQVFGIRRHTLTETSVLALGYVANRPGVLCLPSLEVNEEMDFHVGLMQPGRVALPVSGLNLIFNAVSDVLATGDTLLDFPADQPGFDLPPLLRAQRVGGVWQDGVAVVNTAELNAGRGYVLRLRGPRVAPSTTRYWKQSTPTIE